MSPLNLSLPNSSISQEELEGIRASIESNSTTITSLRNSYDTGIQQIASKITACGVSTANNASPSTIVNNIGSVYTNRYNQGINDGRQGYYTQTQYNNYGNQKYNEGVAAADNRANPNSTNYQTGYNNGVNDGRRGYYTQAQYDANYNNGVAAGKNAVTVSINAIKVRGCSEFQSNMRNIQNDNNLVFVSGLASISYYYAPFFMGSNCVVHGSSPKQFSNGFLQTEINEFINSVLPTWGIDTNVDSWLYYYRINR